MVESKPFQKPVFTLKEGASRSQGKDARHANITAARIVAEAVKSALGPKGMDKMLVDSTGDITITSDGRTMLDEMDIEHPAAKMMVEVAKTQDDEVGDGTSTSVILAGELLGKAESLTNKNVHPTVIIEGYNKAARQALKTLEKIAIPVNPADKRYMKRVAITSMASKIVSENKEQLAEIAVKAVLHVAQNIGSVYGVDLDDIMVEKKSGGSLTETNLVEGLVLDKGVVHSEMPKRVEKAKIALLANALEVKKPEFDAKINVNHPVQMESFLHEEETMLKEMVEKIADTGANVVICEKNIDDMALHFLAKKGILSVRRAKKSDMAKLAKATGGKVVTNIDDLTEKALGYAELVDEQKIGDDKMIFVEGCKNPRSVAILIRGGTKHIVDEAARSVHDALCVVRDLVEEPKILLGGGSTEMEIARALRKYAESLGSKEQLAVESFAEAVEAVPSALGESAGLDPIDVLSKLRARHEKGEKWVGVDVFEGKINDAKKIEVYEPLVVKKQIINSATEVATMILRIDDVIDAGKMNPPPIPPGGPHRLPSGGYSGVPSQH